jgi:hypothetical protein
LRLLELPGDAVIDRSAWKRRAAVEKVAMKEEDNARRALDLAGRVVTDAFRPVPVLDPHGELEPLAVLPLDADPAVNPVRREAFRQLLGAQTMLGLKRARRRPHEACQSDDHTTGGHVCFDRAIRTSSNPVIAAKRGSGET